MERRVSIGIFGILLPVFRIGTIHSRRVMNVEVSLGGVMWRSVRLRLSCCSVGRFPKMYIIIIEI